MFRTDRPRPELPWTSTDRLLVGAAALGALLLVAALPLLWNQLPDRVPTHFGFSGQPDDWGAKSTLLGLPLVGLVMCAGLLLLARVPHLYNYPVPITAANAGVQYRLGRRLVLVLGTVMSWTFLALFLDSAWVALGRREALHPAFIALVVAVPLLAPVGYLVVAKRANANG
jgi:uncharacterized membrane protein